VQPEDGEAVRRRRLDDIMSFRRSRTRREKLAEKNSQRKTRRVFSASYIMTTISQIFNNQQYIVFMLSLIYIYWISDLFVIIDKGPSFQLVTKLCIPLIGKGAINIMDRFAKYNIEIYEWWTQPVSSNIIISYVFKVLQWIYDNGIHVCWDLTIKYGIDAFFIFIMGRILYNFIWVFNFGIIYLFFTCLCTYSVYVKFSSSKTAFVTLIGKFIEMGSSVVLADNLHRVDDYKDYCIKNKNSWFTYIIKLVIGYNNSTDIDGEIMAKYASNFVGINPNECKDYYENSLLKKMSSIVEVSKSIYTRISSFPKTSFSLSTNELKIKEKEEIIVGESTDIEKTNEPSSVTKFNASSGVQETTKTGDQSDILVRTKCVPYEVSVKVENVNNCIS
jgi:hypothetical protein